MGSKWVLGEGRTKASLSFTFQVQNSVFFIYGQNLKKHSPTCLGSPTWCHQCTRVHQQHANSHCMHFSSPTEAIPENSSWKGKGAGPALFSVSPWQPLSPPSGCHIKERSCHLSGLTQALQLLGRSHSPSPRDWRISPCAPPFWNFGVFSFHTKKTKKIWPSYTLKIGNQED